MAAAQFLVVRFPGAQVPGVGFVAAGQFFTSPGTYIDGKGEERPYVPSRYMRAMNEEAVTELKKLKAALEKFDAERAALLREEVSRDAKGEPIYRPLRDPDGRPIRPPVLADEVNLEIWTAKIEKPVVEDAGLSLSELADLSAGRPSVQQPKPAPPASKRVADR